MKASLSFSHRCRSATMRAALCVLVLWVGGPVTNPALGGPLQGFSSDNVEWLANLPYQGAVTATRHGNFIYVGDERTIHILDISDPEAPVDTDVIELPTAPAPLPPQKLTTNGKILLVSQALPEEGPQMCTENDCGLVRVVDVSDKTNARIVSSVVTYYDWSWTCILDCRWAYSGIESQILDLRDPTRPRLLKQGWDRDLSLDPTGGICSPSGHCVELINRHSITEVSPGIVVTGTIPIYLLDARADPSRPQVRGISNGAPYSMGRVEWPRQGRERYLVSQNVLGTFAPHCESRSRLAGTSYDPAFATWDTRSWRRGEFARPVDRYYLSNGTYQDGDPAVSGGGVQGCAFGWLDVNPDYARSRVIALAATNHGAKFVRIDRRGKIHEAGWFLPHAGNVWGVVWASDRIVYTVDLHRGIDILRFVPAGSS